MGVNKRKVLIIWIFKDKVKLFKDFRENFFFDLSSPLKNIPFVQRKGKHSTGMLDFYFLKTKGKMKQRDCLEVKYSMNLFQNKGHGSIEVRRAKLIDSMIQELDVITNNSNDSS